MSSVVDGNRAYVEDFDEGSLPKRPAKHVFVLTCMDARVDPVRMLGLELGDAHVMRNAGGRVSDDAVRSLVVSSALQGTREVLVIHHTDCGLGGTTDDELRAELTDRGVDVGNLWIGAYGDIDDSVREDVATLRGAVGADALTITGHVYDVRTGHLRAVEGA